MDFTHYTDRPVQLARDLVNFHVDERSVTEFGAFLDDYDFDHGKLGVRELSASRALAERLRSVFEAPDVETTADLLNELLGEAKIEPRLDAHGGRGPHFHYAGPDLPVITRLHAFTSMGLAVVNSVSPPARSQALWFRSDPGPGAVAGWASASPNHRLIPRYLSA